MNVFCCQFDIAWENPKANFARIRALLEEVKPGPGSLVVLPELCATGFSMNVAQIADPEGGVTEQFLAACARDWKVYVLGGAVVRGEDGWGRNQALAFSPESQLLARYSKMQPFTLGGESAHYRAGTAPVVFQWHNALVAPLICYDLRFPEVFRAAVRLGAQVFTVIANWPVVRVQHWVTLLQARAIENQAWVVGVNRCGTDPKHIYPGRSLVVNPHGEIVASAGDAPGVTAATIDIDAVTHWRRDFPALKDMRPHAP
jgi:predicted amidohydrolase